MKKKGLPALIIGIILIAIILIIIFTQIPSESGLAVINGWVFEIQEGQDTKRYVVPFGDISFPSDSETIVEILTEEQLLTITKTDFWVEPFETHSIAEWSEDCFFDSFENCNYEYSEDLMSSYLQENNIEGQIANAYVGYFAISGSN